MVFGWPKKVLTCEGCKHLFDADSAYQEVEHTNSFGRRWVESFCQACRRPYDAVWHVSPTIYVKRRRGGHRGRHLIFTLVDENGKPLELVEKKEAACDAAR